MEEATPIPTIPKVEENVIKLDSDEDSFLEFIKEKPQIGQSSQTNAH